MTERNPKPLLFAMLTPNQENRFSGIRHALIVASPFILVIVLLRIHSLLLFERAALLFSPPIIAFIISGKLWNNYGNLKELRVILSISVLQGFIVSLTSCLSFQIYHWYFLKIRIRFSHVDPVFIVVVGFVFSVFALFAGIWAKSKAENIMHKNRDMPEMLAN